MPDNIVRSPDSPNEHPDFKRDKNPLLDVLKFVAGIVAFVLSVLLLWYFRDIVTYIVIAAVLSLMLSPVKRFFKNLGIGKIKLGDTLSSLITIIGFILIISAFISLFIPLILDQARIISSINYQDIDTNLAEPISKLNDFAAKYRISTNETPFVEGVIFKARNLLGSENVINFFNSILGFTGNFLITAFSVIFILFFFLRDEELFGSLLRAASPDQYDSQVSNILTKANYYLKRYFLGILLQISLVTIIITVGMLILGIENALLIGFFAGIVNLIPYVGPFIGALFGLYVGITTNLDLDFYAQTLPLGGGILVVFLISQATDNILLQPLIHSNTVKAHPLEIFVVILIAAKLGGALGMIIAIPTYTVLRVFAKEFLSEFKIVRRLTKNI